MTCAQPPEVLSASLDGELSPDERAELDSHLDACPECSARLESLRALKHALSGLEAKASPSDAVAARIESLRYQRAGRHRRHTLRWAVGLAAAAIIAVVLGFLVVQLHLTPSLTEELVADHLKYSGETIPIVMASNNPEDIRQFFAGKVPFSPVVPSMPSTALLGGRLCKIDGRRVQLLFYEQERRRLSLYITGQAIEQDDCQSAGGHQVCVERRGPISLILVGDAPAHRLRKLLTEATLSDERSPK